LSFKAEARDIDGNNSAPSSATNLVILRDQPPQVNIVTPKNGAVVIDGQSIEITAETRDDLGPDGIERVVFYLNDSPVFTAFQSDLVNDSVSSGDNFYSTVIEPPLGVDGFALQAVAYDVLGQTSSSSVVTVGRIDDTVRPKLSVLSPFNNDILTTGEKLIPYVSVTDIGIEEERKVFMRWIREYQDSTGTWQILDELERELFRDDNEDTRPDIPKSEPDNFYYIYWEEFAAGNILRRGGSGRERVRIETRVETPNETVTDITVHEVGAGISERRFLGTGEDTPISTASSVYYSSIDQFQSQTRTGAMVGAWSSYDPVRQGGLFVETDETKLSDLEKAYLDEFTGIFMADFANEQTDAGDITVYSSLLSSASEIFAGTISEIYTDENFVLAAKNGVQFSRELNGSGLVNNFADSLAQDIRSNPDTGAIYTDNLDAELIIYSTQNGDDQFGIPYLLAGRIDLPFIDTYGLDRKDDLVFVANGNGGVQIVDISDLSAPQRIGFVKPNGFARDVKISNGFGFIAASYEGVVVFDATNPNLPIVNVVDTLGVANKLEIVGNTLYVTDMSGLGSASQINVVNISDPRNATVERTIELEPAREDWVSDGVYDVTVSGNKAYASVFYSDQEDKQIQSVVEVIDLRQIDDPNVDATVPSVVVRNANDDNFAISDLTLARGAVQAAAGKAGINRIEFTELLVADHTPAVDQSFVKTDLDKISIELSAVLPIDTNLADYVEIYQGGVLADGEGGYAVGENISDQFSYAFRLRNGEPAYRFIEITPSEELLSDYEYVVVVKQGLEPLTGNALSRDYLFSFFTSPAGSVDAPDIQSIGPNSGSIEGGQTIVVEGINFGQNPEIYLGGSSLVIDEYLPATSDDELDKITATTIPNVAGPAAITVITENGLEDTVIGAYSYLDILQISFITPAVVDTNQAGVNDTVDIVGFGFNRGIKLRTYPIGQPERAKIDEVDGDRLIVESGERLNWVVPDFNNYRGYVDVEITDELGRFYYQPRALFYGNLSVDTGIDGEIPLTELDIVKELEAIENGGNSTITRDPSKLPGGYISSIATDSDLGFVYVLGRGVPLSEEKSPNTIDNEQIFRNFISPSWLELVRYQPESLTDAAPMVGLGYSDLPQDLNAGGLVLGKEHIYVSARGMDFPLINTEHEGKTWLLVYDREDRLPGELELGESKDRSIVYKFTLPISEPPSEMQVKDKLLVLNAGNEGVLILSLVDPLKPVLLSHKKQFVLNGVDRPINAGAISVLGNHLSVTNNCGRKCQNRISYDLSKPSFPQISEHVLNGSIAALSPIPQKGYTALYKDSAGIRLLDDSGEPDGKLSGVFQSNGFQLNTMIAGLESSTSIVAAYSHDPAKPGEKKTVDQFLSLYDTSRETDIKLIDAVKLGVINFSIFSRESYKTYGLDKLPYELSNDGIVVAQRLVTRDRETTPLGFANSLLFVDTLMLDLVDSFPHAEQRGVSLDSQVRLRFNRKQNVPSNETLTQYLSRYLALIYDDGTIDGISVDFQLELDPLDEKVIVLTPSQELDANSRYIVKMQSEPNDGGRRSEGLFDHEFAFDTGTGFGLQPEIASIVPATVNTTGGIVTIIAKHTIAPLFFVSGELASITSQTTLDAETVEYVLELPPHLAGAASIELIDSDERQVKELGAINYVEELVIESLSPTKGSINGGTTVNIKGRGFQADTSALTIYFGDNKVSEENLKVLNSETLEIVTPPGQLGNVDVKIVGLLQTELFEDAFTYQQPVKANIPSDQKDTFYEVEVDPTGTYAVAAAGEGGVLIYNIDSSFLTANAEDVTNPDELIEKVDKDGDELDDRIVGRIKLPEGYSALGIDLFFERNNDRIFVTASNIKSPNEDSKLFIYSVDVDTNFIEGEEPTEEDDTAEQDIQVDRLSETTLINTLDLRSDYAKGVIVENNQTLVAMGEKGLGVIDSYLHSKLYISDLLPISNTKPTLDVARLTREDGNSIYAVTAGEFDFKKNELTDQETVGLGGFYLVERNPQQGLQLISSLDMPASRVLLSDSIDGNNSQYAYLASGDMGVVIVDVSNPSKPKIIRRIAGKAYDISLNGNILYVANGTEGIKSYDVTDPFNPVMVFGYAAYNGNDIRVVFATPYSAIGLGKDSVGGVLQETPDAVLKLHKVEPTNGILDRDTDGVVKARFRFNKAIDLFPDNLKFFSIYDDQGNKISTRTEIRNNDALVYVEQPDLLSVGQILTLEARAGLVASKPVLQNGQQINLELYRLRSTQRKQIVYRGDRPDRIEINAVLPRRIELNEQVPITISMFGAPSDLSRVRAYIGDMEMQINAIEQNSEGERLAIITATTPLISARGQYDIRVSVEKGGLWQSAYLRGALQVDEAIFFDSLLPQWGPIKGGTRLTIRGRGFEPGNTVTDGLRIQIGSQPVSEITVYSTNELELVTPRGVSGLNRVFGQDRYGNETELSRINGFGYGIAQLGTAAASLVDPVDVIIDRETGVAAVATGYFKDFEQDKVIRTGGLNESNYAATFDIQNPSAPLLVGGTPTLPSGQDGLNELERHATFLRLSLQKTLNELGISPQENLPPPPPLTPEEEVELERTSGTYFPGSVDTTKVQFVKENELGIERKRLYVAAGNAGVARLNFDEQNGLQVKENTIFGEPYFESQVRDILKTGHALFATTSTGSDGEPPERGCGSGVGASGSGLEEISYLSFDDPITLTSQLGLSGGEFLYGNADWVSAGGKSQGAIWPTKPCPPSFREISGAAPSEKGPSIVESVNIYDRFLKRRYEFQSNVFDMVDYGKYSIFALGGDGLAIIDNDFPERRIRLDLDSLQSERSSARRLYLAGSLLFVSAKSAGVIVLDIADPESPKVVSAGNDESILSLDIFKDRVFHTKALLLKMKNLRFNLMK